MNQNDFDDENDEFDAGGWELLSVIIFLGNAIITFIIGYFILDYLGAF